MPEPIKVQVKIDHKTYNLVSTEPEEYLHKVAEIVNGKLMEIEGRNQFIGSDIKMVLTALNLAEDVVKMKNEIAALRQQLKERQVDLEEMEVELICLREEEQKRQDNKTEMQTRDNKSKKTGSNR